LGLLPEQVQAERILSRRCAVAIVDGVGAPEGIPVRKRMVEPCDAEVFPDGVVRIAEGACGPCGQSILEQFTSVRCRPQVEIWRHSGRHIDIDPSRRRTRIRCRTDDVARQETLPSLGIRHDRNSAQPEALPESFVIPENESPVFADWTAGRTTELISLEWWNRVLIKKVSGIQRAVTQELKHGAMKRIRSRFRDNVHLTADTMTGFSRVDTGHDVELAHRIDSKQLPADTARSRTLGVAASRIFDPVP